MLSDCVLSLNHLQAHCYQGLLLAGIYYYRRVLIKKGMIKKCMINH